MQLNPVYAPAARTPKRYRLLYGGAGSGKSVFAAQDHIVACKRHRQERVLVVRKVYRTCRQSTFHELLRILKAWNWPVSVNNTEMTVHLAGGGEVLHAGLDDVEKLKSIAGVTKVWIEEATEITEEDFNQLDLRLRGVPAPLVPQITLTFNPISARHWIKRRFIDEGDAANVYVQRTTWQDNPHVGEAYGDTLASIPDENMRRIYERGEWGEDVRGLIYPVWEAVNEMPPAEVYGLDFGFNAPTAGVALAYRDGEVPVLYVDEVVYESGLTDSDLASRLRAEGVSTDARIYADAAQPGSIEALQREGFNAYPADKGSGSVEAGLRFCQGCRIMVTRRSVNVMNEFRAYKWDERRSGEVLDRPLKWMDHAMDAMRYGAYTHYRHEPIASLVF